MIGILQVKIHELIENSMSYEDEEDEEDEE
jgi:hypothetical protein